jgi:hypothetical protein
MPEEMGIGGALWRGLASGTIGLGESMGSILHWLGAEGIGGSVEDYWKKKGEKYQPPPELQGYVWDKPELLADPEWWAYNVGSIAPSIASSIIPGGLAFKGAKALGAAGRLPQFAGMAASGISGGALEGAGTYREAREAGLEDPRLRALGSGLGSGVLNALPIGNMLRPLGGLKNLPGRMLTTGLAEGLTEAAEEPWQALMVDQPIEEGLKAGANVFFPAMLTGGLMGGGGSMITSPQARQEAAVPYEKAKELAQFIQEQRGFVPMAKMAEGEIKGEPEKPTKAERAESATQAEDRLETEIETTFPGETKAGKPRYGARVTLENIIIANEKSEYGSTERLNDQLVKYLNRKGEKLGDVENSKRGTMSMEDIGRGANVMGMDSKWLYKNIINRPKGHALNPEGMRAAVDFVTDYSNYYGKLYTNVMEKKKAGKLTPAEALEFMNETQLWSHVQAQVAGIKSEWGRTGAVLSHHRDPGRMTMEEIEQALNATGGEGGVDTFLNAMEAIDTEAGRNKFVRDFKPTMMEKIVEVWINSLLSGPQTHVVNMTSNWIVALNDDIVRSLASFVGKFHGGEKVFAREALARITATPSAMSFGMKGFRDALKNPNVMESLSKLEYRKAISGKKGEIIRTPGRFLNAEDMLFKEYTRIKELHALAMREHIETGTPFEEILNEAMEGGRKEMMDKARFMADRATFTERGGNIVRALQQVAFKHPSIKFIIPFIRTPANIVKYAMKHSILAPLFTDVREDLKGVHGKANRDIAYAKIAWGQGLMATIGMLAAQGLVTGGGPDEPRRRQLLYATGWQPYSIKVGDKYYAYGRLEPLGMLFGMGADTYEVGKHATDAELNEAGALAIGAFMKNITSKTWLRGVSEMIMMMQDPDRYGERYIQNFMGTVVPTGVAQVAGTQDPVMRRFDDIKGKIQSRLPGKRKELLPRLGMWGEPIEREGGVGPDLLSPVYLSTKTNDPVAVALLKLGNETGYHPSRLTNKIRGVEITPEMHNELIQSARKPAYQILNRLISQESWNMIPSELQEKLVRKIIQKTNSTARMQMLLKNTDWFIDQLKEAS